MARQRRQLQSLPLTRPHLDKSHPNHPTPLPIQQPPICHRTSHHPRLLLPTAPPLITHAANVSKLCLLLLPFSSIWAWSFLCHLCLCNLSFAHKLPLFASHQIPPIEPR